MNETAHRKSYFQFPLCGLAFGPSECERLNALISYGAIEAGRVFWEKKFNREEREDCIQARNVPADFDFRNSFHLYAAAGAKVIGIRFGSFKTAVAQHRSLSRFRDDFARRYGPAPIVRLRTDFLFEARDRKGITYRELAVVTGIFSVIGNKRRPVQIRQNQIGWRALGYKSEKVFRQEVSRRQDGAQRLTDWQLRSTIESLRSRKFFCRRTFGRRLTYYSNRMSPREFEEALLNMKNRKFISKELRRLDDEALTAKIRNQRAAVSGQALPN